MRGPKRRDIGHGALAERALVPMIPSIEEFPYTIRVVSDILESNGSSSMASVCGSSLSLMDAGVPIKAPVAGIAMGLIKEGDDYIVLTDIAGVEDHLGDMDFKVAGTADGITALQMDIKITGVTFDILRDALSQAKDARLDILGQMAQVIDAPRTELSAYAPRIITLQIDPSKIGMLIGKGGETIRGLSEEFESQIDVNDDGQVLVYSANGELGEKLADRITSMLKDVEVGDEFPNAKVVKTTTFGAFVELSKGTDGLLHISNVSPGQRVDTVEDVLNKGDEISVRVVEVDRERGRIGLRLAEDPEIAGKIGRGARARRRRRRRRRRPRRPRPRPRRRPRGPAAATAATAAPAARATAPDRHVATQTPTAPAVPSLSCPPARASGSAIRRRRDRGTATHRARLGRPGCHGAHAQRALRGAWLLDRHRVRREAEPEAGLSHLIEHMLFRGTTRFESRGDRPDLRRHGRGAERGDRQGDDVGLLARARRAPRPRAGRHGRHGLAAALRAGRPRQRARDRPRGDRDVRGRPAGQGLRRARRGGLRLAPARARDHRPRRGRRRHAGRRAAAFHADRYVPGNIVVAAAGSLDHDELVELVAPRRGGARGARCRPQSRRRATRSSAASASSRRTPSSTTCASAARDRRATTTGASRCACWTTSSAARRSSRLFQEVREQRGLAYAVYSFQSLYAGTGQVGLYLGTRPDNVGDARWASSATSSSASQPSRRPPRSSSAPRRTSRAGSCWRWSRRPRG